MLDINLFRNELPAVAAGLAKRGVAVDTARFEMLEAQRKDIQTRAQELQAKRNALSKQIGIAKGKGADSTALMGEVAGLADELKRQEEGLERVQAELREFLLNLPNLTHSSTPVGKSADDNVEIRRWGTPPEFNFPARDHTDLGEALGQLDFATAAKMSGARFTFLRGDLGAAASRACAVHARHAHAGARLHRVLHAVHRQRRDAGGHDAAAQVRVRHVRGPEGRRRRRERSTSSRRPRSR